MFVLSVRRGGETWPSETQGGPEENHWNVFEIFIPKITEIQPILETS